MPKLRPRLSDGANRDSPHDDQPRAGLIPREHPLGPRPGLEPGERACLAEADAMAESLAGEDESLAGSRDLKPGAANRLRAKRPAQYGAELLAADYRLSRPAQGEQERAAALVPLRDRNLAESLADARPRIGVERRGQLRPTDLEAPGPMCALSGAIVGDPRKVGFRRPAPDVASGTGVSAAVGVKERARRCAVEPENLGRGVFDGLGGERRPARC